MDSGARCHRPLYPEYKRSENAQRNLAIFDPEEACLYASSGRRIAEADVTNLGDVLLGQNLLVFTSDLASSAFDRYRDYWVATPTCKVLCNSRGHPTAVRFQLGRTSRWLVDAEQWDDRPTPEFLKVMESLYAHIGLGMAPTPGSLGRLTMMVMYSKLPRHTSLSLGCEDYFHNHGFGGMAMTELYGHVDRGSLVDRSMAYVFKWDRHPAGTAEYFTPGSDLDEYATYFAHCYVTIHTELALGLFPIRNENGRVSYPTLPGTYETYLWMEQIQQAEQNGCSVFTLEGYGWYEFTYDGRDWNEWMYVKRQTAPTPEVEKKVKKTAVSAVGTHAMGREHYILVGSESYDQETDYPIVDHHVAVDYWVHPERNISAAPMVHWQNYTVAGTNVDLRDAALPYAEEARLVFIDTDGFMVVEQDEEHRYIKKHSAESVLCRPGTWLWARQHNVEVITHRIWYSDEEPNRYGCTLKEYLARSGRNYDHQRQQAATRQEYQAISQRRQYQATTL